MEPGEHCQTMLTHLDDWEHTLADRAAVASLLSYFARSRPSEALFLESLRALVRDPHNGSLAAAATAIHEQWRDALRREEAAREPIQLRPEYRADVRADLSERRERSARLG